MTSAMIDDLRGLAGQFGTATAGALDTDIEFLDGWTVRNLVAHLGGVYAYASANILAGSTEPTRPGPEGKAPDDGDIIAWFADRAEQVLGALESTPADQVTWSHGGIVDAAWWQRRMRNETRIHLWDAHAAAGDAQPIDFDTAVDGIDEFYVVSAGAAPLRGQGFPDGSLHLHCTDGPGEWMIVRGDAETDLVVTQEHGKGDAAVRGAASDLLLWIWGRPAGEIEIFGDEAVASAWQAIAP